jgi:hypothetical protein
MLGRGHGGSVRRRRAAPLLLVVAASLAVLADPPRPTRQPDAAASYPIAAEADAERTFSTAHFSVTWIDDPLSPDAPPLSDKTGDGIPDSVARLADAFESGRAFLIGQLGYREPPVNGPYRVYVAGRGDPAVTKPLRVLEGQAQPSFIIVSTSSMAPRVSPRAMRGLAVHEYFHAIQNGYDSGYDHWIGEASAAWAEEELLDEFDPNHYLLRSFVPVPRRSLDDVDGTHEYGAFLFIEFLVERFGKGNPAIVREVWERMTAEDSLSAIEDVLQERGVSFPAAWAEFQLWRWDLDRFDEGASYQQILGNKWPKPLQTNEVSTETCRLSSDQGIGLPPLSGDYSVFRPARQNGTATIAVEGPAGSTGFALVEKQSGKEKVQLYEIGSDGLASVGVRFGSDKVKKVVLGVANPFSQGANARFGYSLRMPEHPAVTAEPVTPPTETGYFGGLSLRGRVLCDGEPASLADVVLVQDKRSGEQRTFPLATGFDGTWAVNLQPEQTSTYRFEVTDPLLSPASSPSWEVGVRVGVTLEATASDVALGQPISVEGKVSPAHPGALILIEYRRPELPWRSGPQTMVGADGSYGTSLVLPAAGVWSLRASVLETGDQDHLGSSTINDVFVNVE